MIKNVFCFTTFGLTLLCVLAASCGSNIEEEKYLYQSSTAQNKTMGEMRVLWTVSAYKITAGGKWGENEARSLLFKPLDIGSSYITFNGQICQGISFTSEVVDTDKYLSERYQTSPEMLGIIAPTIEIIETNCPLPGFSEYIRLPNSQLIVWIEGVFFVFEPNVDK